MKIKPLYMALRNTPGYEPTIVHTGQHYDEQMSDIFFRQLELPEPDLNLGVGSGSQAVQTAQLMLAFEPVVLERRPELLMVVGDVNSTLACSLVAAKLSIPIAHVEAGLRSHNWAMPEEINRVLTDRLADFLFTTAREADENLRQEGIPGERIFFVGNVMVDTLRHSQAAAADSQILEALGLTERDYGVLTMHRPSNVDDREALENMVELLSAVCFRLKLIFPIHPRSRQALHRHGLWERLSGTENLRITDSLGYLDFLRLMQGALVVLTDSGGIQEETTVLGIPCLTLRQETERPVTVTHGTNRVVGTDPQAVLGALDDALSGGSPVGHLPELWDGRAAERIVEVLTKSRATILTGAIR